MVNFTNGKNPICTGASSSHWSPRSGPSRVLESIPALQISHWFLVGPIPGLDSIQL